MPLPWILEMGRAMSDFDHILGPFVAVASVVAMADVARRARFLNMAFALLIAVGSLITDTEPMIHLGIAALLSGLSVRGK